MEPTTIEATWKLGPLALTSHAGKDGLTLRTSSHPALLTNTEVDQLIDALIDARDFHLPTATTTAKD